MNTFEKYIIRWLNTQIFNLFWSYYSSDNLVNASTKDRLKV